MAALNSGPVSGRVMKITWRFIVVCIYINSSEEGDSKKTEIYCTSGEFIVLFFHLKHTETQIRNMCLTEAVYANLGETLALWLRVLNHFDEFTQLKYFMSVHTVVLYNTKWLSCNSSSSLQEILNHNYALGRAVNF